MIATDLDPALARLYADFEAADLRPLWTQREDLMPLSPRPRARPHAWRWDRLRELAARAGELVPVGRGGERRAIALANPGLAGEPHATPTLWAAIQYLGPGEVAPAHRHTQAAFRFIVEGEGVWTVVNDDPVEMRPGDLLLTASWDWHGHHHAGDRPMVWLDGLDIPLVGQLDAAGHGGAVEPGHAAIRFANPTTGRDALITLRTEMHRLRAGCVSATRRATGSAVWQVFAGAGVAELGGERIELAAGDLVALPSWCPLRLRAHTQLDLFTFSDAPVYEALGLHRSEIVPEAGS